MSVVGYYRYKTTADVEKTITWTVNFVDVGTKTIVPITTCAGDLILKYIDKNGQYRFYPFNKFYKTFDTPRSIGATNKFITSILTDQTNKQNIGYRNERKMNLTADVPNDELEKLIDIYTSPRIYLYVGDGITDIASDWLEIGIEVSDPVVRRRKSNTGRIDITLTLPENFTVAMV